MRTPEHHYLAQNAISAPVGEIEGHHGQRAFGGAKLVEGCNVPGVGERAVFPCRVLACVGLPVMVGEVVWARTAEHNVARLKKRGGP